MTLGDGIFYASLVISVTALFIATKDRWNWKKILLWPIAIVAVIAALGGSGLYLYNTLVVMKPRVQETFWDITLNTSKADIKFMKGEPTKTKDNVWTYHTNNKYNNNWTEYRISFEDGKVWYVWYYGSNWLDPTPLQEIRISDPSQKVLSKFGQPTYTSISDDQLRRVYSYDNYHVFFVLEHDQVMAYGMFNPAIGSLIFEEESNAGK